MNFIYFDPTFLKPTMLKTILEAFKISEIYNLMSCDYQIENYMNGIDVPITVYRNINETIDNVKRRAVYSFVSKISHPIIVYGEFLGDCQVDDKFRESNCSQFANNLRLSDPNILILIGLGDRKEESQISISRYILNILKKYSNYNYQERLCFKTLSAVITTEYEEFSFSVRIGEETPAQILSDYVRERNPNSLAELFLSKEGITERNIKVKEQKEEDFQNFQMARAEADNEAWQQTIEDELGYIVENGGDWILD